MLTIRPEQKCAPISSCLLERTRTNGLITDRRLLDRPALHQSTRLGTAPARPPSESVALLPSSSHALTPLLDRSGCLRSSFPLLQDCRIFVNGALWGMTHLRGRDAGPRDCRSDRQVKGDSAPGSTLPMQPVGTSDRMSARAPCSRRGRRQSSRSSDSREGEDEGVAFARCCVADASSSIGGSERKLLARGGMI